MEPTALATLTSAVTVLVIEGVKGAASEAGKDAWNKIKSLLNWSAEPAKEDLSLEIAKAFQANEALARQVIEILQTQSTGSASSLVGKVQVGKGSVTIVETNTGTINNTLHFS